MIMTKNRHFFLVWLGCIIGTWSIIPYLLQSHLIPESVPLAKLLFINTLLGAFIYAAILWLTSLILPKTDLKPFATNKPSKGIFLPGAVPGILVGLTLIVLEKTLFLHSALSGIHPSAWAGALASIYGAINEEVLLRLFLFSLIYFLLIKICKHTKQRSYLLWGTNILVALLFGLGHLPAALKLVSPTTFEISRVLLLNGIPGLVFGWLYWSRGFYMAVVAHFVADLMIHVIS